MTGMAVKELSIALDDQIAAAAAAAAERHGLSFSAWLNLAAQRALAIEDGLTAVAEWEAEHGALTPDEMAAADVILDATQLR